MTPQFNTFSLETIANAKLDERRQAASLHRVIERIRREEQAATRTHAPVAERTGWMQRLIRTLHLARA